MKGRRPAWVVGVDIGGTNLRVGTVPLEGGAPPVAVRRRSTRAASGSDRVLDRLVTMIRESVADVGRDNVAGIGLGAPGPLDRASGVVTETPNLGWRDYPLRDLVAEACGLPVTLDNDANCFTYGEWWMGAGRGSRRLVGITLGTGIGGGIVIDGEIHHGASGAAGEVGHMSIDFRGRRCPCGARGCIEAYASGPAIAVRAVEAIADGGDSILASMVGGDLGEITAEIVCRAAAAGDPHADGVVRDTARILATAVTNLIHLLNPDAVVIGGGVANAGDRLLRPLRREVRRRVFGAHMRACRIVQSELGDSAGVIGAAGVFMRAHHGRPR
ncbi:MAG: ROK family protein [Gemmatimonadetes bacterium]|nr:ROK family protein [Gemmatimonadota bacterium]MCY3611510.1 ROK family protein [Gemmatimonadota bacterium]